MNKFTLIIFGIFFSVRPALGGILTPFTESSIDSVEPGQEYLLRGPRNVPFMIKNISESDITVRLRVMIPSDSELEEGFEAIPQADWISIEDRYLTISPEEWGETKVILQVPYERKYRGKSYQAYIHAFTTEGQVRAGLKSRILFSVKDGRGFFRRIFLFWR